MARFKSISHFNTLILSVIIFVGIFLRFYKLDWGNGYHFHPDEYHLIISAEQLNFPTQTHPHFFSYGSVTIYLIYLNRLVLENLFKSVPDLFLIGRFYSALYSSLTLIVIFAVSRKLFKNKQIAILPLIISVLSPGLVQQAHFATPESAVTFWMFLFLFLSIKYIDSQKFRYIFLPAISFGMAISTKITPLITFPTFIIAVVHNVMKTKKPIYLISHVFTFILIAALVYLITNPYTLLDYSGWKNSFNYETGVARGTQLVFYTRQFINTSPVIFQYKKILSHAIDPVSLALGTLGFFILLITSVKKKPTNNILPVYIMVLTTFSTYFFFNSFMFAKWTRFIAPTFPFFSLFSVYVIDITRSEKIKKILIVSILLSSFFWGLFFSSIYFRKDVRIEATNWIQNNLPQNSYILTETGNTIEVPFSGNYIKKSFDFYRLDEDSTLSRDLVEELVRSDYFIVQSRRIFLNHNSVNFPITSRFYNKLFDGSLGFEQIQTFTSFPSLNIGGWSLEIKDEKSEETWSVFDHPVVRIYKKEKPISERDYENILQIN